MLSLKQKSLIFTFIFVLMGVVVFGFAGIYKVSESHTVSFSLTDQSGEEKTHTDFSGQFLMVFFGFTSCDDICPIGMTQVTSIMSQFDEDGLEEKVTPLFISVDPERDSIERIADYLENFDSRVVGLTGSRAALEKVTAGFNTFLDESPAKHSHAKGHHSASGSTEVSDEHAAHIGSHHATEEFIDHYQLRHSSVIYLVGRENQVIDYISLEEKSETVVKRLRHLMNESNKHS